MSNKRLVTEYFAAVWSDNYDPAKWRELADKDILFRYPNHGEFHGIDAAIAMLDSFRESFPDLNFWATEELLEDGDYVIARWEGGGTHTGKELTELVTGGPIPAASGKKIFFGGTSILKISNGKVVEDIGQEGTLETYLQLQAVVPNAPQN